MLADFVQDTPHRSLAGVVLEEAMEEATLQEATLQVEVAGLLAGRAEHPVEEATLVQEEAP